MSLKKLPCYASVGFSCELVYLLSPFSCARIRTRFLYCSIFASVTVGLTDLLFSGSSTCHYSNPSADYSWVDSIRGSRLISWIELYRSMCLFGLWILSGIASRSTPRLKMLWRTR